MNAAIDQFHGMGSTEGFLAALVTAPVSGSNPRAVSAAQQILGEIAEISGLHVLRAASFVSQDAPKLSVSDVQTTVGDLGRVSVGDQARSNGHGGIE